MLEFCTLQNTESYEDAAPQWSKTLENNKLYKIKYEDGDAEQMYHNEVHSHKDPIKTSNISTKSSNVNFKVQKSKDICLKYRTRS